MSEGPYTITSASSSSSPVPTTPVNDPSPTEYMHESTETSIAQPTNQEVPTCPGKQQRKDNIDPVDKLLINALSKESTLPINNRDDADTHFCLSLVEIMKSLPPKKNLIVKSKIMMLVSETLEDYFF